MNEKTSPSHPPTAPPSHRPITQPSAKATETAKRRLIILGASNVTRSFATLLATARAIFNEPLEIFAAHGHGRSYGAAWSTVLVRKLPGILSSGLWNAVQSNSPSPTAALVTDIGNDILYEFRVPTIASWVEECLDRLAAINAPTIVSALPLENIFGLSEARYKFFRNLFVPGCSLRLAEVTERSMELNERVIALAVSRGMSLVAQRREWYGLDPLHVRFRHYPRVWREVLSGWHSNGENAVISRGKLAESLYLRSRVPQRARWFGRELGALQPSARLRDGTTVALY